MSEDGEMEIELTGLLSNTTYQYRAFINAEDQYYWAEETKSFTTKQAQIQLCPDDNHPHMIDLGLPSGTKWACCNVGASKPEDYGELHAWGEVGEYWGNISSDYEFNDHSGSFVNIGLDIAGTNYDIAHTKWGNPWRIPTKDQCEELIKNCSSMWTNQNGVNGYMFIGTNGNSIFLPAAGFRWYERTYDSLGQIGHYWSSTLHEADLPNYDEQRYAYHIFFGEGVVHAESGDYRDNGNSVRPVQPDIEVASGLRVLR